MADEQEKTFEPTDHKIQESRKKGDIPKSQEVTAFGVLFFGTFYLVIGFTFIVEHISSIFKYFFHFNKIKEFDDLDEDTTMTLFLNLSVELAYILLPLFLVIFLTAVIANLSQFGFLLNPIKLDVKKLNPISGFQQLFAMKKVVEFLKMLLKILVLLVILFTLLYINREGISKIPIYNLDKAFSEFFFYVKYILAILLLIIAIFALVDLVFVRYHYFKKLMMSMQEIKDEYKNTEGNPEIKQKIKQLQHETAQRANIQDVADAKVVITNPDHYAIAIKQDANFETNSFEDPVIIAKGKNEVALKIKQVALENDVEIIENKPLARALYASVEPGQVVPDEFMEVIFDILIQLDYIQDELKRRKKQL